MNGLHTYPGTGMEEQLLENSTEVHAGKVGDESLPELLSSGAVETTQTENLGLPRAF